MIIPDALQNQPDYRACVDFHGHTCMGLTLGYFAAKLGLDYLNEQRALDEELVCITETDACCCDAIQILTGCTFGKGNLIYEDVGKMAFTFGSRASGVGVRISMRAGAMDIPEAELSLREKIRAGKADQAEIKHYEHLHEERSTRLFDGGPDAFFTALPVTLDMPPHARMAPSRLCQGCQEPVMETKLVEVEGKLLCRPCRAATGDRAQCSGGNNV
jgi:formylmethanofuran dehydrogenase subunit E